MARKSVKSRVLSVLNRNKGAFYSGQELADSLDVTRATVWKAIEKLRQEGYKIVGATNKGYSLDDAADIHDPDSIRAGLSPKAAAFYHKIVCLKETVSTNTLVKELYGESEREGLVLSAETQTGGRGRFGRAFHSPKDSGVYFSVLLKPQGNALQAGVITAIAAVAGARACEKINRALKKRSVKIKWVNDLYLNGRKICGILTEGSVSLESGKMDYAVLGVGINLTFDEKNAPKELQDVGGGLFQSTTPVGARAKLIAAFLNEFYTLYVSIFTKDGAESQAALDALLKVYRERQLLFGKKVDVVENLYDEKNVRSATAVGVDDKFRLLVSFDDEPGKVSALNGGEVRLRPQESLLP